MSPCCKLGVLLKTLEQTEIVLCGEFQELLGLVGKWVV